MLVLHILQGPDRGMRFELPADEPQLIGRSSEALPITDTTVSRRHAELTPDDGRWFVRDLESANGTFVNGEKITGRIELAPGDQIRCGATLLIFATNPDVKKHNPVQVLPAGLMDVTVEGRVDPNEESMILAAPDPLAAAREHLRIIYAITAITTSTLDRDEMLNQIMDLVFDEFRPERGFVLVRDDITGQYEPAAVRYKTRPKSLEEGQMPISRTIIRHVVEGQEGVLSTNAMTDTRFGSGDSVREYGIRSAICVPIRQGDDVFGVIHIDSSMANFTFTDAQLRLMNAVGQHAALAIKASALASAKMATARLAAVGETVASLSHSIKNILQGLRGGADAVELALNKGQVDLAMEGWPILSRNLDRIYALTLNMLAYSKPMSFDFEFEPVDDLIHEIAALVQPQCDRKRIGLILDLAEDIPLTPIDLNAMHQALMNLVTNAIEAVEEKKGVVTIRTRLIPVEKKVVIEVADNGPGVPKELHEQIFQAFRTTKGQRGTGLGLAVTRKIVTAHQGEVQLESAPGQGATFSIILPTGEATEDPSATRLPDAGPTPRRSSRLDEEF